MSPPDSALADSGPGQPVTSQKFTVEEIIKKIQTLSERLSTAKKGDGYRSNNSHDNVGGNTSTTAIDGNQPAEKNAATDSVSKEKEKKDDHKNKKSKKGQFDRSKEKEKKDDHKNKKSKKGQFDRNKVNSDLEKLCKELEFMKLAFQKLKKFEDDLTKAFKTLEKNVEDIEKDLPSAPNRYSSAKQVQSNLHVLRNNITKIKIQIPLQHHSTQTNSESRGYKETVASKEHDDLPNLNHDEPKLKQSAYCSELFQNYEELDLSLKLCLLSFAVFPENAEVKKRLLRYWWVGEDIIPPGEGEAEFTNKTLKKFMEMKFIEPVYKKSGLSPRSYRMYPIVRSALISQAKKELFFDYDPDGNPTMHFSKCYRACLVKVAEESSESISKYFSKNEGELGILQTLFNVSEQFPDFKEEWFSRMKMVRVLYLGRWERSTKRHIEVESNICFKGLSKMKNLRFLSLQGISGIKTLPNSLCQAVNLTILDLQACHNLEELPKDIGLLKNLTHLDISECYLLDQMPEELSSLSELKIFKGFVISDHKNSCSLKKLTELENLEKLSINITIKNYSLDELGTAISKFGKLKKLKVAWGGATLTPVGAEEEPAKSNGSTESQGQREQHISQVENQDKKEDEKQKKSGKVSLEAKKLWGKLKSRDKESDAAQSRVSNQEKTQSSDNISPFLKIRLARSFIRKLKAAANQSPEVTVNPTEDSRLKRELPNYNWKEVAKLELQCYPEATPPSWLAPQVLPKLNNLYIRGGRLHTLPEIGTEKWKVKTLRLKYLSDLQTDWKELREMFPNLEYLERVRCPKVMFCPCNGNGWCYLTKLLKDGKGDGV